MVGATLAAVALFPLALALSVLAVASMTILIAMRLWSLLLFFSMALAAIILLLVIVRIRISRTKSSQQGAERKSFPGILGKARFPDTPMPLEPPLVRVLETVDLSQTGVEHFLDLQESGNTGSYSLTSWKEAQTSLPGSTRE